MAEPIYVPNAQGHNFIPFGALQPGVSNLKELDLRDQDPTTGVWDVVKDLTGWTAPRVRFYSTRLVDGDFAEFLEVAATFDANPLLGIVRYEITAEHISTSLIPNGRRYGQSVDAINPDGKRVPLGRGSAYLTQGAP